MMQIIPTVLGNVSVDELGVTNYHEHLSVESPGWLYRIDPDFALIVTTGYDRPYYAGRWIAPVIRAGAECT